MAIKLNKFRFAVLAGGVALAMAANMGSAKAQSSVEDDAATANTLISAATSSASASGTASIIAGGIASAIAPPAPSIAVPSAPGAPGGAPAEQSRGSGSVIAGNYFNTRSLALAGKSAGAKQPRLGAWVQGAYTVLDNEEAGGKFDGSVFNVVAGIDYKPKKLKDKGVVGMVLGYEDLDVTTAFNAGTFEGSGITVAPYFGYALNKNWAVDVAVGYSWLDYDNSRTNNAVTGSFEAERLFGAANLGGNFFKKRYRISPKVGIMGVKEDQDAYIDSTGVAVAGSTTHLGRATGGVELGFRAKPGIEPFISGRVNWDFNRNSAVTLANGKVAADDEVGGTFAAGVNLNKGNISGQIKGQTDQFKNEVQTFTISGRVRVAF